MRKLILLFVVLTLVMSGLIQAATNEIVAIQGKVIQYKSGSGAWVSEERLKTRSAGDWSLGTLDANKSYLQFDVSDFTSITSATLKIYAITGGKSYDVSGLNDGIDELWSADTIDWFSAPGNDTTSGSALNASQTVPLYSVDPTVADGADTGDVTSFVAADTDGLVTFILTAGGTTYIYNVIEGGYYNADYVPVLTVEGSLADEGPCEGVGIPYTVYADVSCRTDSDYPDTNRTDSSKLSIEVDTANDQSAKSWIKFNIADLDLEPNSIKEATLRLTLHETESQSETFDVSAVNDNYQANINWGETDLTWNNAPANDTTNWENPDFTKATWVKTVNLGSETDAGDQHYIDVKSVIQSDTDGIVQFILHKSSALLQIATHDHSGQEDFWPQLYILVAPKGADYPSPCPGDTVTTDLAELSWTNPDPNDGLSPITCTVYLGTEPNLLEMDSVTLDPDASSVLLTADNFENFAPISNAQTYYWAVDCFDPSAGTIPGLMWDFTVNNNEPPSVNAGEDQVAWLGMSGTPGQEVIDLLGSTSDDGLPNPPGAYSILWTQEDTGAPSVLIDPNDVDVTSVTITERGMYQFRLTADDGDTVTEPPFDIVQIVVGDDACDASHIDSGEDYNAADFNQDCIVDLTDFVELISKDWLNCTNTLFGCDG